MGTLVSGSWELAGQARRDFADVAAQLDDDQWGAETWCQGWTPHHVLAHLVWHIEQTVPSLLIAMVRSRFDFNKAADRAAWELAKRPREELLTELRARSNEKPPIPTAPESGSVMDTAVHTQDLRRMFGLDGTLSAEIVRVGLDFLTTHRNARFVFNTERLDGLQFVATDLDWSYGTGPTVEGAGEAIMMSLLGRPSLSELQGTGRATFGSRLAD